MFLKESSYCHLEWWQTKDVDEVISRREKKKVIVWVERSLIDCTSELVPLCDTIITRMDARYAASATEAAFVLGNCFHV